LINNSLKYSDNDTEVNIRCRFYPRSSKLHIQVLDNGIGIAEKDSEIIFKPYTTLPEAHKFTSVGAGLGLYTCKTLCKQLNSSIMLMKESEIDPLIGKTGFYVKIRAAFDSVEEMKYQFK
jgi:signal transduction histidine kinase